MTREVAVADMHMHTCRSDGANSLSEMVGAVGRKVRPSGLRPVMALTDHNRPVPPEYFRVTRDHGVLGVGGAELLFQQLYTDIREGSTPDQEFKKGVALGCAVGFSLLSFDNPKMTNLATKIRSTGHPLPEYFHDVAFMQSELFKQKYQSALSDKENGALRTMVRKRFEIMKRDRKHISSLLNRSEVLTYYTEEHLEKISAAIEKLNTLKWDGKKAPSFEKLMDFLGNEMGEGFDDLVFILAHPQSIDITRWGSILTKLNFLGSPSDVRMVTFEMVDPKLRGKLSGGEVINAGHPVEINDDTKKMLVGNGKHGTIYDGIGPSMTGNSDAHDCRFVLSAYTLLGLETPDAEGVLYALRQGYAIPRWGIQAKDNRFAGDIIPFLQWLLLSPLTIHTKSDGPAKRFVNRFSEPVRGALGPRIQNGIVVVGKDQAQEIFRDQFGTKQ